MNGYVGCMLPKSNAAWPRMWRFRPAQSSAEAFPLAPKRRNCMAARELRRRRPAELPLARNMPFGQSIHRIAAPNSFPFREDAALSKTTSRFSRQNVRRPFDTRSGSFVIRPESDSPFDEPFHDEAFESEDLPEPDDVLDSDDEDLEIEHTGEDDRIDDPVRIYLMQMGEIPLLSRRGETAIARRIDRNRRGYRQCMLATDYVLQAAIGMLEAIRDNKLRLDRTIEVSVVNLSEKTRLLKVLGPNLRTLRHLMLQNRRDFALAIRRSEPEVNRRRAWRRLLQRRVKAVRLVEEMGLRTRRLQPALEKLRQIADRMETIRRQLASPCRAEEDLARAAELR